MAGDNVAHDVEETTCGMDTLSLEILPHLATAVTSSPVTAGVKVLNTFDLLENILFPADLSPAAIEDLKWMSKTWRNVLKGSRRLRPAAVRKPDGAKGWRRGKDDKMYRGHIAQVWLSPDPIFLDLLYSDTEFNMHPRFSHSDWRYERGGITDFASDVSWLDRREHLKNQEHATSPPCAVIFVASCAIISGHRYTTADCVIYNPDGVRMGDIAQTAAKLNHQWEQMSAVEGIEIFCRLSWASTSSLQDKSALERRKARGWGAIVR